LPSACWACPRHPRRQGIPFNKDFRPRGDEYGGTTAGTPASRHSVEERIGVLEELLNERYSVRAFRPDPVPQQTIEHVLKRGAAHGVMVQQPAVASADRKR